MYIINIVTKIGTKTRTLSTQLLFINEILINFSIKLKGNINENGSLSTGILIPKTKSN